MRFFYGLILLSIIAFSCSKLPKSQITGTWNVDNFESKSYYTDNGDTAYSQYWYRLYENDTLYDIIIDLQTNDTTQYFKLFVTKYEIIFNSKDNQYSTDFRSYNVMAPSSEFNLNGNYIWENKKNHLLYFDPEISVATDWKIECRKHKSMDLSVDFEYQTQSGTIHEMTSISLKKQ